MISLTIANVSRLLKDKKLVIGVILVPALIIVLTSVISFDGNPRPSLSVTDYDNSAYSKELIDVLSRQYTIALVAEDDGYTDLKAGHSTAVLVIPSGFFHDEAQQIKVLKLVGRTGTRLEATVNHFLNARSHFLEDMPPTVSVRQTHVHSENSPFALSLIINFIFYSVILVVGEVNDLKRWRLLSRIFTTPNSSRTILGSIVLALFALLFMQFLGIAAASTLTNFSFMSNFLGSTLLFGSYIIFVLSVGILIGRFVSNSNLTPVVINIIIAPLGIISGTMIPKAFTPAYITKLDFLTPQYWVYSGVETLKTAGTAAILPNVVILLLMGLCCFTAGAFRFNDLVEQ